MIGKIVIPNDAAFPAKVIKRWPNGGWKLCSFRQSGVDPNKSYNSKNIKELGPKEFDKLSNYQIQCIIKLRDKNVTSTI